MITISILSPNSWQEYKTIQLEALQKDPHAFGSKYEDWVNATDEKWQERPGNPDTVICIAKDDEKLIGLVGLHREKEKHLAEIWGMYVNEKYRGMGIGKRLMEKIISEAKKILDVKKVTLMVNPQQHQAQKLYESFGFLKTGTTPYLLGDGNEYEVVVMEKVLR